MTAVEPNRIRVKNIFICSPGRILALIQYDDDEQLRFFLSRNKGRDLYDIAFDQLCNLVYPSIEAS